MKEIHGQKEKGMKHWFNPHNGVMKILFSIWNSEAGKYSSTPRSCMFECSFSPKIHFVLKKKKKLSDQGEGYI